MSLARDVKECHMFEVIRLKSLLINGSRVVEIKILAASDQHNARFILSQSRNLRMWNVAGLIHGAILGLGWKKEVHSHKADRSAKHVRVGYGQHRSHTGTSRMPTDVNTSGINAVELAHLIVRRDCQLHAIHRFTSVS